MGGAAVRTYSMYTIWYPVTFTLHCSSFVVDNKHEENRHMECLSIPIGNAKDEHLKSKGQFCVKRFLFIKLQPRPGRVLLYYQGFKN
jgi:hypothetical protein